MWYTFVALDHEVIAKDALLDHGCQLLETNRVEITSLHDQHELNMR